MIGKVANIFMRRRRRGIDGASAALSTRSPRERFFELVEQSARQDGIPHHVAMARLRTERPLEFQAAFPFPARSRRIGSTRPMAARSQLLERVSDISARQQVPQHVAMAQAREEHPELVAAWH